MEIIIASQNKGKLKEFDRMLSPLGFSVISAKEAGFTEEVEETGKTFAENAEIKARAVFNACHRAAVADDSGLEVDALNGAPGVYTARYAGEHAADDDNIKKLLSELEEIPQEKRTARFVSAICCILENGEALFAVGTCEGIIGFEKRGENGFGYDPVFMVGEKSFAELDSGEKDSISHRGRALRELLSLLEEKKKEGFL